MGNSWGKAQVDPCFGDFGGKADEAGCFCFSAKIVSSQHCSLESAQAMASTFVSANRAKGSLGEAIIYKVFYPSVEGAVARRLLQLFTLHWQHLGSLRGGACSAMQKWLTFLSVATLSSWTTRASSLPFP